VDAATEITTKTGASRRSTEAPCYISGCMMTTIFTDDFCRQEIDVALGDYSVGFHGRELIVSTNEEREFRLRLTDEQLRQIAEELETNGYIQREIIRESSHTCPFDGFTLGEKGVCPRCGMAAW